MGMKVTFALLLACLAITGSYSQKPRLRVVSILDSPYLMQGDDGDSDKYEGFCEDLAEMVSEILGVEHDIHVVKDGRYGSQNASVPGRWTGIIGELINNEADMAIAPLTISAARAEVVDFTTPFQDFQLGIMMQKKTNAEDEDASDEDETLTIFAPFNLFLWLSILFAVLGLIFVSLVVEWSFKSPETHGEGFINFLRQDSIFRPESITGKVIRFVYLVFIVIVIAAYTASFSVLREIDSQPPVSDIQSIKDLVQEDDMTFGIIAGGSTAAYLKSSNDPLYKKLYDVIDMEQTAVANYAEGLSRLRGDDGEHFAFLIEAPKAEYFVSQEPCDLFTAAEEFGPSRGYAIATPKNSPYSERANIAILKLKENGKLEQLIKKYWNDLECSDSEDNGNGDESDDSGIDEEDFDALNLSEMASLFYFLFGGLILIILVWIIERRATA